MRYSSTISNSPFGSSISEMQFSSDTLGKYRYGFNAQEKDDEVVRNGDYYAFEYRMHDSRLGRFLSVDPLAAEYPWNSPYAFAENRPLEGIDLEGLEFYLPRPWWYLDIPVIRIPQLPAPPIPPTFPIPPVIPLPPQLLPLPPLAPPIPFPSPSQTIPNTPTAPTRDVLNKSTTIDWTTPPSSPSDLGAEWQEITNPKNTSGSREFKNQNTNEEIRWDPGKSGADGWEGYNHWHRTNPEFLKNPKAPKYLDKSGNPVNKGSNASHIDAGATEIPGVVITPKGVYSPDAFYEKQMHIYDEKMHNYQIKLHIYNILLDEYKDQVKEYEKLKQDYNEQMDQYYEQNHTLT